MPRKRKTRHDWQLPNAVDDVFVHKFLHKSKTIANKALSDLPSYVRSVVSYRDNSVGQFQANALRGHGYTTAGLIYILYYICSLV